MQKNKKKLQNESWSVTTLVHGLFLGIAEIIPGVSGSTVALLLGIYDDFIDLLFQGTQLVKTIALFGIGKASYTEIVQAVQNIRWKFGITLGLGMISAIITLSSFILYLLLHFPHFLFAFLIGLTPPTIAIVYQQIKKPKISHLCISGITTMLFLGIFIFGEGGGAVTDPHPVHLFLGGMIAISAMVLPGVSGSFMLLVLGLYNFAVGLIASLKSGLTSAELLSLITLLSGMVIGLFTTVRVLKWAFDSYRNELMSFLLGLLLSSWYVLWPFVAASSNESGKPVIEKVSMGSFSLGEIAALIILAGATAGLVYGLHSWADKQDPQSPKKDGGFDKL